MPKMLNNNDDMNVHKIPSNSGTFQFSAVRPEKLGASCYTLATIAVDRSRSTLDFAQDLLATLKKSVEACKKNPMSKNILLRVISFNEELEEIHGYKLLKDIDIDNDYKDFNPKGMTALRDAYFSSVGATLTLAEDLSIKQHYDVNGIIFVITDGIDNKSRTSNAEIHKLVEASLKREDLIDSMETILVELKDPKATDNYTQEVTRALEKFKKEVGVSKFINVGDATPENLAKLGQFISESFSSTSSSIVTGKTSQPVRF